MKKNRVSFIISAALCAFAFNAGARENVNGGSTPPPSPDHLKGVMSVCSPATAQTDLDINNVRATLLTGGDMWWNLTDGKYLVPKPPVGEHGPTSLFAGSLWIGGFDPGNTLKVAAMTYRQTGNDFWPGPLSSSATTDAGTCVAWDKHFKINRADCTNYYNWVAAGSPGENPVGATAMDVINNWPTVGPELQEMAPFWDVNNNTIYEPWLGEVPDFDVTGTRGCSAELFGDQSLFWVFNDKGNIHTETGGAAIGLEIQAQAFAFQTNDEINNMTFYRYKILNKSSFRLDSTFFGVWVDADLGSANDDYVGCDVERGLGFCYNGDLVDDNPPQGQIPYGANPPAIGVDFFEGPYADSNGVDDPQSLVPASFLNYENDTVDDERIGMKKFVYYNNDNSITGNPNGATDFYGYLAAAWPDGSHITYGGTGHLTGVPCDYMFPGNSDPSGFGTNMIPQPAWDEATVGNVPADRRFLQSAGPFTLQPGAVNRITMGVVWARTTQGGNLASVALMKGADSKAQLLFNNCFQTLDGPTAPNLAIQELANKLIMTWSNPVGSNNYNEQYVEDPDKSSTVDVPYQFEGYQIYQLKDNSVSQTELGDIDKARLVFQCDIDNGQSQIVNFYSDIALSALVPVEMVNGADNGIVHSCEITEDKFAVGDNRLINHKTYYYTIVAYGWSPIPSATAPSVGLDYLPYISGRKSSDFVSFTPYAAIPHIPNPELGGTEAHSDYGTGPKLTRIEGQGNGGNILDFTSETVAAILASSSARVINPTYDNGRGPVNIKVVDPLNVPTDMDFEFTIYDTNSSTLVTTGAAWMLVRLPGGSSEDTIWSEKTIAIPNEQLINGQPIDAAHVVPRWGISVNAVFSYDPGSDPIKNGFREATMSFTDATKQWLTGLPDMDGNWDLNWIRSGTSSSVNPGEQEFNDYAGVDDGQDYEKVLGGTWAPYRLCAYTTPPSPATNPIVCKGGPAWNVNISLNQIKNVSSVDVVITSDKSKWTRCPVIELCEESALSIGGTKKMNMRSSPSVDKDGRKSGDAGYNAAEGDLNGTTGMGWFPGYAINLETGDRLNMAFGEDSHLDVDNGRDMKWNPTSSVMSPTGDPIFGGKHYIYVFGHNGDKLYSGDPLMGSAPRDCPRYDEGKWMHDMYIAALSSSGDLYRREIYTDAMWVNIPLLRPGFSLRQTDVKVRLRVSKSYQRGYSTTATPIVDVAATPQNANFPMYTFNTRDIETHTNDAESAKNALDLINIVPNPYYAYSAYEKTTLENIVKITNLPDQCTVSIYTLNGTLIRRFKKDDTKTSLDWDMKNTARIPVASGMYIIHVDVPNVGEKILKWFGVMRPVDLETY
jgi:hypothetical protein